MVVVVLQTIPHVGKVVLAGNSFLVLRMYLVYNTVVVVSVFWLWWDIVL
jgi:hypothetical protein